ncbi:MAG: UvrD-helicase domain-containing protein [Patescibacteria group bacterium]|nr:UvrD-helicase domain-containing protein [Patescibacteria group bacterium]
MENLMEKLNKEQLAAVMHKNGPLLIVAGAGTGKTTVITQRIAYLIEQGLAAPDEILALTFTEKAAGEMADRVDQLLPYGYVDLWISTFHGFGERVLRVHGLDIGLPAGAKLLNEFGQYALVKNNFGKFDLDYYRPLGNPNKFIYALIKHFSRCKDEDINPANYLAYADELRQNMDAMLNGEKKIASISQEVLSITDKDGNIDKEILAQEVNRINEVANAYHVYQQLLLENEAMDFGDLINYCLRLFQERPMILKKYQKQFKYILLDEFQDTNWAQYELIKMLAAPKNNLVVVGDDDQSIYKFRGASLSNILQFKKDYLKSKEIVLIKNYRNKQNILDLAYGFIQLNNPNRLECVLNKKKNAELCLNKKLIAENKGKGVIKVIKGEDLAEEMRAIAEKIADIKIREKDSNWNDFGILVRANSSAKEICATLDAAGLPYQFLASRGLYTKPIILDLAAYLKLLDNYHENSAVYRIINMRLFEFSEEEIINFNFIAKKKAWSLYTVLKNANGKFGEKIESKIDRVINLIEKHTALARDKSASEVVTAFLNDSKYLKYIMGLGEMEAREQISYLNKFMKRIQEFEAGSDEKTVRAFLNEFDMEIESGSEGVITPEIDAGPEAIKIMTAHAAKGLEFKYIFIANLVDLRFPTIERREAIQIPDALVKEILPEGDIHLQEERRLFYVAITRAKEQIYFSWALDYGGTRKKKPSRFLIETGLVDEKREARKKHKTKNDFEFKNKAKNKFGARGRNLIKLPSYFSYTQLAAFNNCPYQYQLAHIIKVPRRSKHTFSFGQTMHLTLQKIFQLAGETKNFGQADLFGESGKKAVNESKLKISWEIIKKVYEDSWIDEWYESEAQKKEYKKLGEDSLKQFIEKYKENWPNTVSLEQGINLKISGYRIFGKIDRVDKTKNGIQIVDYKTGTPKSKDKISAENKEQLLIYQLACEQAYEKKIENLQFYYLNNNSEINFIGTDKELKDMEKKILERIEKIKDAAGNNYFPAKPGPLCKFCDFSGICEHRKI